MWAILHIVHGELGKDAWQWHIYMSEKKEDGEKREKSTTIQIARRKGWQQHDK